MALRMILIVLMAQIKSETLNNFVKNLIILPEGDGRGGKDPDEKAGLGSWLVGAGDEKVESGLQLPVENHLSLVGMAVSRSARRSVQHPAQIETLLFHLVQTYFQ